MKFLITQHSEDLGCYDENDILFVDGSIKGYKSYDHHITGEKINLDAMPKSISNIPKIVCTTLLDTDAICSAVTVYFGGESNIDKKYIDIFRTASTYCDHLIPNDDFSQEINRKGLGFHLYLKEKGFKTLGKCDKINNDSKSDVFNDLCNEIIHLIKNGADLPNDTSYLNRIDGQTELAKQSIVYTDELITAISSDTYIDPLAYYKVINTPLAITQTQLEYKTINTPLTVMQTQKSECDIQLYKYGIGVNPKYYGDYGLKNLFTYLNNNIEEGWGGRNITGGSPYKGSTLPLKTLVKIISDFFNAKK